jgi:putative FmdB family regulatory protein
MFAGRGAAGPGSTAGTESAIILFSNQALFAPGGGARSATGVLMPIYAYRCASCGHELDALQKLSEPALVDCPACGAAALSKLVTAAGFQLKGSGWYATDFRSGSKPAAKPAGATDAKTEAKTDAKSDAPGTASTESKGDAKAESPGPAASSAGCGSGCSCH